MRTLPLMLAALAAMTLWYRHVNHNLSPPPPYTNQLLRRPQNPLTTPN